MVISIKDLHSAYEDHRLTDNPVLKSVDWLQADRQTCLEVCALKTEGL